MYYAQYCHHFGYPLICFMNIHFSINDVLARNNFGREKTFKDLMREREREELASSTLPAKLSYVPVPIS